MRSRSGSVLVPRKTPREAPTGLDRLDPAPDLPEPVPPEPGDIEAGVLLDLEAFPPAMRNGAIARSTLLLARQLDDNDVTMMPRDTASYVQRIGVNISLLREMSPGEAKGDATDDARGRRETRLRAVE